MKGLRGHFDRAAAAAATLTGKRFGLLVASSVVATSAIVAGAMTGTGNSGALAALLGRSLAAGGAPAASSSPAESAPSAGSGSGGAPVSAAVSAVPSSAPPPAPSPVAAPVESAPSSEPPPAAPPAPEAGLIKHVFVISLTSPGYEAAFGETSQMPYLATLRPKGELLSGYTLLDDAGMPNGVAAVSGQPPNASTEADCPTYAEFPPSAKVNRDGVVSGAGCVYPVETLTIADQLGSGGFSWRAYIEGMAGENGKPANCVHPDADAADAPALGAYASAQNPFVHFHSLLDLGDCAANDVPIEGLPVDLGKAEKTANYSYIAPTPCDAGSAGQCPPGAVEGAAAADAFLAKWVPQILSSPAYEEDGLLIVAFGAASPPAGEALSAGADDPLHAGALLVSRFLTPGATDAASLDPYALLRTTEDLFGLEHLGLAAGAKVKSLAPALLGETSGD